MGMNYRGNQYDIPANAELDKLDKDIARQSVGMRRLTKTTPNTWSNGSNSSYPASNLDHVIVSQHLTTKLWANKLPANEDNNTFEEGKSEVDVRGWVDEPNLKKQDQWIEDFSDHSYLYFEISKI
jgi:hypothetical protein